MAGRTYKQTSHIDPKQVDRAVMFVEEPSIRDMQPGEGIAAVRIYFYAACF
jgi:hypothetical protein